MVQVSQTARSTLFQALTDQQLDDLVTEGKLASFRPGELIIRQGDEGDVMYLILGGLVEVIRILGTGGPQFTRLALGEGEFFGELALLLEGQTRIANVMALEPTTCLILSRTDLERLLTRYPLMAVSMLTVMGRRLRAIGP